jgi:hypothetical protein
MYKIAFDSKLSLYITLINVAIVVIAGLSVVDWSKFYGN